MGRGTMLYNNCGKKRVGNLYFAYYYSLFFFTHIGTALLLRPFLIVTLLYGLSYSIFFGVLFLCGFKSALIPESGFFLSVAIRF